MAEAQSNRSHLERQSSTNEDDGTIPDENGSEEIKNEEGCEKGKESNGQEACNEDETDGVSRGVLVKKQSTLRTDSESQLFNDEISYMNAQLQRHNPKKEILRDLDLFVLDNSLRETTIGQIRGHTLDSKRKIYEQVKKVGFQHVIVEAFNHMTQVGEPFIRELIAQGENLSDKYVFSEFIETIDENRVPKDDIPIGLLKMKEFGINNVVMEVDLVYYGIDYSKFKAGRLCSLLSQRFKWIRENLSPDSHIFVSLRDFSECMTTHPKRLLYIVHYLARLPDEEKIFGIAFEESGRHYQEQLGAWTTIVRRKMNQCGWYKGHLIAHIHEQFGMADVVQLECLANGANGIWAGLCEEGAAMGHASSCLTIMNLIRMGNSNVIDKFNCKMLRAASRAVTEITTGRPPHPKQPVCGERALDVVFGLDHEIRDPSNNFYLPEFFDEEYSIRMTMLSTPAMILEKMKSTFGDDPTFTIDIAAEMKKTIHDELNKGYKNEYNSPVGLAVLFDKSGGKLTSKMSEVISQQKLGSLHQDRLLNDVRKMWDEWDLRKDKKDHWLDFTAFYNGFMAPFFSCYRCDETRKALQCLDMNSNGKIDWNEFAVFLKWAVNQYPDTESPEELLSITFRKGIVPAMQDEIVKNRDHSISSDDESSEISRAFVKRKSRFYPILEYEEDVFLSEIELSPIEEIDSNQFKGVEDEPWFTEK